MRFVIITAFAASLTFFGAAVPAQQVNQKLTDTLLKARDAADRAREAADAAKLAEGPSLAAARRARVASLKARHADAASRIKLTLAGGDHYDGQMRGDQRHGNGIIEFRDGDRFEGET